jgi:ABC-type sugar transport system permease subunit
VSDAASTDRVATSVAAELQAPGSEGRALLGRRSRLSTRRRGVDRPRFLYVVMAFVLIFLFAPIAVVVVFSFNNTRSLATFGGFSTQWYSQLFHASPLVRSLFVSL